MTLLEMLVAVAVFAVVAVIAYAGLRAVLAARQATQEQASALSRLQTALSWLTRDLRAIVRRPVRDAYGDRRPALDGTQAGRLEWTRAGWPNPTGRRRSTLQRVAYRLEGGGLVRDAWFVLDRAQDTKPHELTLLDGVSGLRFRMLNASRQWQDVWPGSAGRGPSGSLPVAVEVVLDTRRWGEIRRLVPMPEGP
jgi:general secretion pathway protein J